ncbi:hypothetical protein NEAUS03_1538 [Nematocida ausubeli]|nr:hypothetical protein NEAUS03_1538 [Nematocida ausubeli]
MSPEDTQKAAEDCGCADDTPCTSEYLQAYKCFLKNPKNPSSDCMAKISAMKECYIKREKQESLWSVRNIFRRFLNK